MVRNIVTDISSARIPSVPATKYDVHIALDLYDTLDEMRYECAGLSANMIGVNKRIIAVQTRRGIMLMMNPTILKKHWKYEIGEASVSISGIRRVTRYKIIKVEYEDIKFNKHVNIFVGLTAQIIQHEVDHCNGIII